MSDLTSRFWIIAKGVLFVVIVAMSGFGVIVYDDPWHELGLLLICLWAACRFYYFLFYVLERYVGLDGRYTGILDLGQRLWRASRRR
ncbi:MAG TPA: hypothetical protein VHX44_05780 [Planctomycetota bacterium]|jgi:hypothetical protein|nr:hypothetical protein [Planctomycetota bacterium]